jgi:hypothetical protein
MLLLYPVSQIRPRFYLATLIRGRYSQLACLAFSSAKSLYQRPFLNHCVAL